MENINKIIGANLRAERINSNLTQKEIAEKVGYSEKSISKWESGSGAPGIETLLMLSKIFGTDINSLVTPRVNKPYFLGIDGGGTKTEYCLTDYNGNIIKRFTGDCSNPIDIGIERSKKVLKENIVKITEGINPKNIYAFAGISGGTTGNNKKEFAAFFKSFGFAEFENDSDIKSSVALGLGKSNGMIVIMGTGVVGFAVKDKLFKQIGGWGQLFDAGGGGYNLGKDALYACLREHDGTGEKTLLTKLIEEKLGTSVRENLSDIYSKGKKYIASFSIYVVEAAAKKDKIALEIIDTNMKEVAKIINSGLTTIAEKDVKIALNGSLIINNPSLCDIIHSYLDKRYNVTFEMITEPPVKGALIIAKELYRE